MSEVKERLYEAIDVVYEGDTYGVKCRQNQIRLGRLTDGRLRLYIRDELGDYSVELNVAGAAMLSEQLQEALGKRPVPTPPLAPVPFMVPNLGTNSARYCSSCGKWVSGYHLCVRCDTNL